MTFHLHEVRSLAARTDLFLLGFQGEIRERDGYLAAETPGNPGYYWGNYLFFPSAPKRGDLEAWLALFRKEFGHNPKIRHTAFGWDEPSPGENEEFLAAGFLAETGSALSLKKTFLVEPASKKAGLAVRPLKTEAEWEAATQNQIQCRPESLRLEEYIPFKRAQMLQYREMSEKGHGHWWGAFLGEELVADCGLFFSRPLGRFQNVGTSPLHRRQGFCRIMIHEICRTAFAEDPGRTLVIVAESGAPADHLYRSLGFSPEPSQFTLARWPSEA